jgi:hypothetical protein
MPDPPTAATLPIDPLLVAKQTVKEANAAPSVIRSGGGFFSFPLGVFQSSFR